jgi:hypothetical protein
MTGGVFEPLVFREIASDDIHELAAAVHDAFVGYRAFAPTDWQAPPAADEARRLQRWVADAGFWGEVACDGQTYIGHATFIPAERHSFRRAPDASSAHLLHLFVEPDSWSARLCRSHTACRSPG